MQPPATRYYDSNSKGKCQKNLKTTSVSLFSACTIRLVIKISVSFITQQIKLLKHYRGWGGGVSDRKPYMLCPPITWKTAVWCFFCFIFTNKEVFNGFAQVQTRLFTNFWEYFCSFPSHLLIKCHRNVSEVLKFKIQWKIRKSNNSFNQIFTSCKFIYYNFNNFD